MRNNKAWFVGRNLNTKEWTSGGVLSDYPREHWEVYRVGASDRDQAVKLGQAIRAKAQALTANQKALLANLFAEIDGATVDPSTHLIELEASELRVARALADKGLIVFHDDTQVNIAFNGLNLWQEFLANNPVSVQSEAPSADQPRG